MKDLEFEIVPAGKPAWIFVLLLGLLLPLGIAIPFALAAREPSEAWMVLPAIALIPLVAAILGRSMHRRKVILGDKGLVIRHLPWSKAIPVAEFNLDAARVLNLSDRAGLQPVWKVAGTALPGFRAGRFRLRDRSRANVLLTSWTRILVLPRRDGSLVLLSPQRPEALLDALQRAAG